VNSGGEGGDEAGPPIGFCGRLRNATSLAGAVAVEFDTRTAADCRVAGIPWLYVLATTNERATFLNELFRFNLALWGCTSVPPTEFKLIYQPGLVSDPRPITAGDAALLIEHYLAIVTPLLGLSQPEIVSLTEALRRLSSTVVSEPSLGYSRSSCTTGGGGAGGEGGSSDAGSAGAGGAAGAGGEGGFAGPGGSAPEVAGDASAG
jgi:hypothetical protein